MCNLAPGNEAIQRRGELIIGPPESDSVKSPTCRTFSSSNLSLCAQHRTKSISPRFCSPPPGFAGSPTDGGVCSPLCACLVGPSSVQGAMICASPCCSFRSVWSAVNTNGCLLPIKRPETFPGLLDSRGALFPLPFQTMC
jgi:hypothetical protein